MDNAAGLQTMHFEFSGSNRLEPFAPRLVGVVGSGNLEILIEASATPGCAVEVQTSARGFEPIWLAVLQDFQQRHQFSGVQLSINDMGATPAVVGLRLRQAVAALAGDRS